MKMRLAHRKVRSSSAGSTLLELAVALGIISLGVMGIIKMHFEDMKHTRAMQEEYIVERLIENEWAHAQASPPPSGASGAFRHTFDGSLLRNLKTNISTRASAHAAGLLEVRMEVNWFSTQGRFRHKEAVMLLYSGSVGIPPANEP